MSSPGITPEFDDDTIHTLHSRWSARSARYQAMMVGPSPIVPEMSTPSDGVHPDTAVAS